MLSLLLKNEGDDGVHNYLLVDIIEVYDGGTGHVVDGIYEVSGAKFMGNNYKVGCYTCELTRVIKETTFNKMLRFGLIEFDGK